MKKNLIISTFIVLAAVSLLLVSTLSIEGKKEITINDKKINTEIAKTTKEKQKGLMFRENLPRKEGMLFTYNNEGNHTFWMKNTLIPLKIIWISKDKEIVHIEHAIPCKNQSSCEIYSSPQEAKYVLEISPETFEDIEIKKGDKVEFSF